MQNTSLVTAPAPADGPDLHGRSLPLLDRLCEHGWRYDPEPARPVVVGCDVFLATPLARTSGGWRGVLIEWPGRPGIPAQPVRRAIHTRVARVRRTLTLFTDAAGLREVRGWCTPSGLAPALYREDHRRRQSGAPEGPPRLMPGAARSQAALRGARETAGAFIDFLRLCRSEGESRIASAAALVHWLGVEADADGARRVWRGLERFRVLDPEVGDGDWLVGALEVLVAIGAACLDRMEGWVEDLHALAPGPRRQGADFTRLLQRRDEMALDGGRDRIVHELVLLGCLRGFAGDPGEAREVRRKLAARVPAAGASSVHTPGLVDVRALRAAGRGLRPTAPGSMLHAQAEMLLRAESVLRRLRLEGSGTLDELREGRRAVARRRSRLDRAAGKAAFSAEWREQLLGAGFHLVRAASVAKAENDRAPT